MAKGNKTMFGSTTAFDELLSFHQHRRKEYEAITQIANKIVDILVEGNFSYAEALQVLEISKKQIEKRTVLK